MKQKNKVKFADGFSNIVSECEAFTELENRVGNLESAGGKFVKLRRLFSNGEWVTVLHRANRLEGEDLRIIPKGWVVVEVGVAKEYTESLAAHLQSRIDNRVPLDQYKNALQTYSPVNSRPCIECNHESSNPV